MCSVIITTSRDAWLVSIEHGSNYGLPLDKITGKGTIPISKGKDNIKIYMRA